MTGRTRAHAFALPVLSSPSRPAASLTQNRDTEKARVRATPARLPLGLGARSVALHDSMILRECSTRGGGRRPRASCALERRGAGGGCERRGDAQRRLRRQPARTPAL